MSGTFEPLQGIVQVFERFSSRGISRMRRTNFSVALLSFLAGVAFLAISALGPSVISQANASLDSRLWTAPSASSVYMANQRAKAQKTEASRSKEPEPVKTPEVADTGHADNGKWEWPVDSRVQTSPFGFRADPINGSANFHTGLDIGAACGNDAYASREGQVSFAGVAGGYGNRIVVVHGNGMSSSYNHLQEILVKVGDQVKQSQVIGKVGTTGHSTGCHMHFEIMLEGKFTDPLPFLNGTAGSNPKTYGYAGYQTGSPTPSAEPAKPGEVLVCETDQQSAQDYGGNIPNGAANCVPKKVPEPESKPSTSPSPSLSPEPSPDESIPAGNDTPAPDPNEGVSTPSPQTPKPASECVDDCPSPSPTTPPAPSSAAPGTETPSESATPSESGA